MTPALALQKHVVKEAAVAGSGFPLEVASGWAMRPEARAHVHHRAGVDPLSARHPFRPHTGAGVQGMGHQEDAAAAAAMQVLGYCLSSNMQAPV